ncbi:MAG: hypothetical protein AAF633_19570, partial [Chloroflexota bacterium]
MDHSNAQRWIAIDSETGAVVGRGSTGHEALQSARQALPNGLYTVGYEPDMGGTGLTLHPLLQEIAPILATLDMPIYLVGGAVRDALLGKASNDLDFVVPANGIKTAFRIGDLLDKPAYPLDKSRDVGRVVLKEAGTYLDFAVYRGETLEEDLLDRDFTLNAMAIPALALTDAELIDPTGGWTDIGKETVRMVSNTALTNDPLRMLRGVRMQLKFGFQLDPNTAKIIQKEGGQLSQTSNERVRDELINILRTGLGKGITLLDHLQLFSRIIELPPVEEETQLSKIAALIDQLGLSLSAGFERFNPLIDEHLARPITGNLTGYDQLLIEGIYYAASGDAKRSESALKALQSHVEGDLKRLKFSAEMQKEGKRLLEARAAYRLLEVDFADKERTTRMIHRFWKRFTPIGLDLIRLRLAAGKEKDQAEEKLIVRL